MARTDRSPAQTSTSSRRLNLLELNKSFSVITNEVGGLLKERAVRPKLWKLFRSGPPFSA